MKLAYQFIKQLPSTIIVEVPLSCITISSSLKEPVMHFKNNLITYIVYMIASDKLPNQTYLIMPEPAKIPSRENGSTKNFLR